PAGAAGRAAGVHGPVEPGDRRPAVPEPAHGGVPPVQGVPQAGGRLPGRAGQAGAQTRRWMIGWAAMPFAWNVASTNLRNDGRRIRLGRNVPRAGQLAWLMSP